MSADRLAEIKARAEAKLAEWPDFHRDVRSPLSAAETLRIIEQVESLERWKFEAIEVMSGLRELGKALGLGLGVQITGPAALAEVARLTEAYQWTDQVLTAVTAERDTLAAQVARVEAHHRALAKAHEQISAYKSSRRGMPDHADLCTYATAMERCRDDLRAALTGSEADTSDTQSTDQEA